MKNYAVAFDFTDITEVTAKSEDEALEIANDIFEENYPNLKGELNILDVSELTEEELLEVLPF